MDVLESHKTDRASRPPKQGSGRKEKREMNITFSPTTAVPVGQNVTATAKAINIDASNGDTSEFSAPRKVTSS